MFVAKVGTKWQTFSIKIAYKSDLLKIISDVSDDLKICDFVGNHSTNNISFVCHQHTSN